ncbi:MAG: helix-turn-helix transcriptional regulator [Clostridia bacterium]|nr:helix-turn-helix transcriptional regulator [Clostridia bacterium]
MEIANKIIITDIEDIATISYPKRKRVKINNRKCYGLSFCIEGQITYTCLGKKYISDPHHAIILPQGQSYSIYGDKQGTFPLINFKCMSQLCDTMIVLPIENPSTYIKEFEYMKALSIFERNNPKVMSIFYDIIYRLLSKDGKNSNILLNAEKFLENNFDNPKITNEMLAKQCGISEIYFRKLFSKQYGITPHQYIINIRVNKAKQLLTDGVLKVNAISEKCGFSNSNHFCRIFKEKTGLTPMEYMNRNYISKI